MELMFMLAYRLKIEFRLLGDMELRHNIMVACHFNMCFTFVMAVLEGSTHVSRIFTYAISNLRHNFSHLSRGKYYVVETGYPLQRGYLKPYPETWYHLPNFARGSRPVERQKLIFNQALITAKSDRTNGRCMKNMSNTEGHASI